MCEALELRTTGAVGGALLGVQALGQYVQLLSGWGSSAEGVRTHHTV
jgi:hypothetical protein